MLGQERSMLMFAHLAAVSERKGQLPGRDKFLILTAASACRSGWIDVAERCREKVLTNNPSHLIGHAESFVEAMRGDEMRPFLKQLMRFCSGEKAEHLLSELGIEISLPDAQSEQTVGKMALSILDQKASGGRPPTDL